MARSSSLAPGFRFHPTDEELVMYYLKKKLLGMRLIVEAIAEVNIYDFSPWDLPDKSNLKSKDLEWFFFCPKSRKYLSGLRSNRATETGFWKATGKERHVEYKKRTVARIRTLVFHLGHASNVQRTDWVMHEYRMDDKGLADLGVVQDAYVLCKIYKKNGAGPKNGAQYGAPFDEKEWDDDDDDAAGGSGGAMVHPTVAQSGHSVSLTAPGSSSITTCANEGRVDVPANDDTMLRAEEIDLIMGTSTEDVNGDNKDKEKTVDGADDGIYDDLANLIHLEDLDGVLPNNLKIDYRHNAFLNVDDLDADLSEFFVD